MNRGIDHLVLCVRNLDRARDFYERLGFTVTPRARHPFGTGNNLIQLQGNFIELLGVVEPDRIAPPAPGAFSFGDHNRRFLESGEGMSMLALESDDARRDQREFAASGLATHPVFDFERKATLPDGRQVPVAFSLAYVTEARLPGIAFFVCQQYAPEYFWKPDYQRHANGATAVSDVIMVADRPGDLAGFFGSLESEENVTVDRGALTVRTARGRIVVLDPGALAVQFPGAAPAGPRFAAYRVVVPDLARVETLLAGNAQTFRKFDGRLQIDDAFGMVIEFAVST
ncbi:MAG TPA: VOC family protein [Rhodospirillales bacterium]